MIDADRKPRLMFALQPALGWRTFAANLRKVLDTRDDIDAVWCDAPLTGIRRHFVKRTNQSGLRSQTGRIDPICAYAGWAGQKLRREATAFRPDVIHCAGHWLAAAFEPLDTPLSVTLDCTRRGIVADLRPDAWTPSEIAREDAVLRRAALIWPMSAWAAATLPNNIGQSDRCRILPPSMPLGAPANNTSRPDRLPKILFVGNDFARKGGEKLVSWVRGPLAGKCHLYIVSSDAPPVTHPDITILGQTDNKRLVSDIMPQMDILCLPTQSDMSPQVLVEAASAGLAVVATRMAGLPELVRHQETGILVPRGSDDAFITALNTLIENPIQRQAYGQAARKMAEAVFDASRNFNHLVDRLVAISRGLPDA